MKKNKNLKDKTPSDIDYTIDGYPVEAGISVWDPNLRKNTVLHQEKYGNPDEPVWYRMSNGDSLDGMRMRLHHPSTGELASN